MNKKPLPDEAALLSQVSCGDECAFKQLYEHYSTAVYRVAYRYLHSSEMAQDVVQEIFLTIWNRRAEFRQVNAFQSYLFFMTRNLCLKYMKDLAREATAQAEFSERIDVNGQDTSEPYHALLDQALQQLPPQQKRIFELAKIQGLSHEMIARILNLSASTVNNHITAALKSIKLRLQQYTISLAWLILSFLL
ncbi:RNA polymerase sigma factor [Dyadobacter crusticola]|uniref:RNA polymerase sigma factor n=1 Tax=Dyadobacter crusticola TaxID=292407 RepID=UPI0004E17D15|nr:RNA polymerase sigma-70 factor [Dyadobacter crusticola]